MTQPPSNPYGQPPGNPYGQNPYGQPRPPRRGRSNVARFWIGVALSLPALFVAGALQAIPRAIAGSLSLSPELGQFSTLGLDLVLFAAFIWGLVVERTRYILLGILAGTAILFVVAAGACVLLLAGLASGN